MNINQITLFNKSLKIYIRLNIIDAYVLNDFNEFRLIKLTTLIFFLLFFFIIHLKLAIYIIYAKIK